MVRVDIEPEAGEPESPVLANVQTDADGRFSTSARVPPDLESGRYRVAAANRSKVGSNAFTAPPPR